MSNSSVRLTCTHSSHEQSGRYSSNQTLPRYMLRLRPESHYHCSKACKVYMDYRQSDKRSTPRTCCRSWRFFAYDIPRRGGIPGSAFRRVLSGKKPICGLLTVFRTGPQDGRRKCRMIHSVRKPLCFQANPMERPIECPLLSAAFRQPSRRI